MRRPRLWGFAMRREFSPDERREQAEVLRELLATGPREGGYELLLAALEAKYGNPDNKSTTPKEEDA